MRGLKKAEIDNPKTVNHTKRYESDLLKKVRIDIMLMKKPLKKELKFTKIMCITTCVERSFLLLDDILDLVIVESVETDKIIVERKHIILIR